MNWFKKEEVKYITIYEDGDYMYGGRRIFMTPESVSDYIKTLNGRAKDKDFIIRELEDEIKSNTAHNLKVSKLEDKIAYLEARLESLTKYTKGQE